MKYIDKQKYNPGFSSLITVGIPAGFRASILAQTATITEISYQGVIAASEFLTYDAKKIYVGAEVSASGSSTISTAGQTLYFYDAANNPSGALICSQVFWDATAAAARMFLVEKHMTNVIFSRILNQAAVLYLKFIGIKIVIP